MLAPRPRGFSLAEILVVLTIVVTLSAILIPVIAGRINPASTATLVQNLQQINVAVQRYKENVHHYPKQLLQLSSKPGVGALDLCGEVVTSTDLALWRGPYLSLVGNSSGIMAGEFTIGNTLSRSPTSTTHSSIMNGLLELTITNVPGPVVNDLEAALDEGSDLSHGNIIYQGTTLTYSLPVRGC